MKIVALSLISLILISLVIINIAGKNVFLDINGFSKTFVVAASGGSLHLAVTSEAMSYNDYQDDFDLDPYWVEDIGYEEIFRRGPFVLHVENNFSNIDYLRFGWNKGDSTYDYSSLEFPLIFLPLAPIGLLCILLGMGTKETEDSALSDK